MLRKVPLIVILGSTGTGKTKLSIELAERFGGEIISADSMQVYTNLDIATAKATKEEQARVKHHLLDITTPDEPFTVLNFRDSALPIIENLLGQSKTPIVVGGTNYYIESLVWDILVNTKATEDPDNIENKTDETSEVEAEAEAATINVELKEVEEEKEPENGKNPPLDLPSNMDDMASDELHTILKNFDPVTADRIHPNNKRKIIRAIEVYQKTGKTLSATLKAQREQPGGNRLGGPLRYPHTILFWLRCRQDILNTRLNKRIDDMVKQGLLREIRAFHNIHKIDKSKTGDITYTRGVLQTIGFKEFIPYLEKFDETNDQQIEDYLRLHGYKMPTGAQFEAHRLISKRAKEAEKIKNLEEQQNAPACEPEDDPFPPGLEELNSCLSELKMVTQRYSKKQIKWINNRFLASKDRQVPDVYELDTSNVKMWKTKVFDRALNVIDCYRRGDVCEIQPMPHRKHPSAGLNEEVTNFCEICKRSFVGEFQWIDHLQSNKHKREKFQVARAAKSRKRHAN